MITLNSYDYIKAEAEDDGEGPLLKSYHFSIDPTDNSESYEEKIKILQAYVKKGEIGKANEWNVGQMVAICFDSHLYYPLFSTKDGRSLNSGIVPLKMRPLAFDSPSEVQFVQELETFYQSPAGRQIIGKRSLYLLRNADNKAKGLGFALAGNFYPDFLLWLVDNETGKQWLNFVDPKGLRQINLTDPKLQLYQEVKTIEQKLAEPNLTLNAFIVSATRFTNLLNVACDQSELEARNVLFMDDGGPVYLKKMFERMELPN